jgi:hypothetical protein
MVAVSVVVVEFAVDRLGTEPVAVSSLAKKVAIEAGRDAIEVVEVLTVADEAKDKARDRTAGLAVASADSRKESLAVAC